MGCCVGNCAVLAEVYSLPHTPYLVFEHVGRVLQYVGVDI